MNVGLNETNKLLFFCLAIYTMCFEGFFSVGAIGIEVLDIIKISHVYKNREIGDIFKFEFEN